MYFAISSSATQLKRPLMRPALAMSVAETAALAAAAVDPDDAPADDDALAADPDDDSPSAGDGNNALRNLAAGATATGGAEAGA
eukprot:13099940-Alexandrium_andersonii.AAC.1